MIPDIIQERITNGVAVGGVTLPLWFDYVQSISEVAAAVLPILGVVWITVQMIGYFKKDK